MAHPYFLPSTLEQQFNLGGLLDRMFDASFPWKVMQALNPEEGRMKQRDFAPVFDFHSDPEKYTLVAEIAGVPKEQVKLEVHQGVLTLSGEKKEEKTEGQNKQIFERSFGCFERSLKLPADAAEDQISASHKDGVLTITIPRVKNLEQKKVISIA